MRHTFNRVIAIVIIIAIIFVGCCKAENPDNQKIQEDTVTPLPHNYISVPDAYKSVLFDYYEFVEALFSDDFENKVNNGFFKSPNLKLQYEWNCMVIDSRKGLQNISSESFGYSLYDINNDGVTELLLLREDYFILAVFTISFDKPQLLDAYWYNHRAMILESGNIFVFNDSGADSFEYEIQSLEEDNTIMVHKTFGCDSGNYYVICDGKQVSVSQQEFSNELSKYPKILSDEKKDYMIDCGIMFQSITSGTQGDS